MAKLSFTFLLLLALLGFASARFIPREAGALQKRNSSPLERVAMVSDNPRYFLGLFRRADGDGESCPIMYQQCSDDGGACCKVGENCGTWDNTPGCCPTDALCQGGIATRTTISIVQIATLTASKVSLPTIQFGGFTFHISGLVTLDVPNLSVPLPTIAVGGGKSTSVQKVVIEGPHARVTGDYTDNNATVTPEITGSWTEVYASLTATGTDAEETGTDTESGTETVSETDTETITTGPTATATVTGSAAETVTATTTDGANSAATVGVKVDVLMVYYAAATAMVAVMLGFAVVA